MALCIFCRGKGWVLMGGARTSFAHEVSYWMAAGDESNGMKHERVKALCSHLHGRVHLEV